MKIFFLLQTYLTQHIIVVSYTWTYMQYYDENNGMP